MRTVTRPQVTEWVSGLRKVRKFLGAASGAAAIVIADGLIDGTAATWTTSVLAAATAAVVYLIPNEAAGAERP